MSVTRRSLAVLVADDDEDDRRLIKKAWEKISGGHDIRFVEDGEELIEYLHHAGAYIDPASSPCPSLILLDLNMPRKDGREALRDIKGDPQLRHIPIVILTTSQADEDISSSYDLGANSYITKPASFGTLVDVLEVLGRYWSEIVDLPPQGIGE